MAKAVFNHAVNIELIEKNPLTKTRFPKLRTVPRDRVLSQVESERLLNVIDHEAPHLSAIVRFALQVPCRKSELVNMRREDLDLINNAIRVRNGTTKNDAGCWKPIPPDMVEYFRTIPRECPYLFYREHDSEFKPLGDFKKAWSRCLRLAEIHDFRFHDTRHISATEMLNAGTPEQVVMTVAGWKSNMLKTYYHLSGTKALEFVVFPGLNGHKVDTSEERKAGSA